MSLEPLPAEHLRVLLDGLPLVERYGLLLAGGYALRAHRAVERPSRDLDLATATPVPLQTVAEEVATGYRALGYGVTLIEASPRSARLLLTLPGSGERLELDLLKEALGPGKVLVSLADGTPLPVLPLRDAVGLKVRALHDRFVARDIIDLQAAAILGGFSFIELETLGRHHEPNFELEAVCDHLAGVPFFDDEDFAAYGLARQRISTVRAFAARWHEDLAERLGEKQALDEEY